MSKITKGNIFIILLCIIASVIITITQPYTKQKKTYNFPILNPKVFATNPTPKPIPTPTQLIESWYKPEIPLDKQLQQYIWEKCSEQGVDYLEVLAVIKKESTYNPKCISADGKDKGLMQIRASAHQDLIQEFHIKNLLDPYQNVKVGIYILSKLQDLNQHKRLMAYNMGVRGMNIVVSRGFSSSKYSRDIVNHIKILKEK